MCVSHCIMLEYYSIIDSIHVYEFNRVILGIPVRNCIVGMMLNMPYCSNEYIISHVVQKKLDVIKNYSDILAFDLCSKVYCLLHQSVFLLQEFKASCGQVLVPPDLFSDPDQIRITMDVIRIRSELFRY